MPISASKNESDPKSRSCALIWINGYDRNFQSVSIARPLASDSEDQVGRDDPAGVLARFIRRAGLGALHPGAWPVVGQVSPGVEIAGVKMPDVGQECFRQLPPLDLVIGERMLQ